MKAVHVNDILHFMYQCFVQGVVLEETEKFYLSFM